MNLLFYVSLVKILLLRNTRPIFNDHFNTFYCRCPVSGLKTSLCVSESELKIRTFELKNSLGRKITHFSAVEELKGLL